VAKSPEAFRTISEVADELALPQHVLRFWETRFTQIRPLKRGGGRRYYRPDDVDLLRGIRYLLYGEGYTIRGVQRLLREQGPRFVIGAGRGNMAEVYPPQPEDALPEDEIALPDPDFSDEPSAEEEDEASAPEMAPEMAPDTVPDMALDMPDEPDEAEPAFNPREFRQPVAAAEPSIYAPPPRAGSLGADDIRRLKATLAHLLDLKRQLDSAND
jgi:DNA-binding transcriptional MerR regulator